MSEVWWVIRPETSTTPGNRLNGGPISTEVLEAAGAAGVSDADICIVDDSKDRTEESAKRTNPSDAVTRLKETRARAAERLQVIRDYLE
jgi:hypothetical protein